MTQGFTLSYSPYTLPKAMPIGLLSLPSTDLVLASDKQALPQTAPMFSLPSDIIYHILWDLSDGWVTLNPTTDIWVFTRVSRSLRLVALNFANLWARISLEPDDIRTYKRHAVDILRTILDRTTPNNWEGGAAHLRLRVHVDMLLVHANLLDILTAHYTRWYSLDLHISLFLLNTLSAQMAPLGFPLLSHLRLSLGTDQTNIPNIDVFSLCPALKSVEFDSIPRCKALRLPWARLTRLVVKERVRSDFLRMLLSAPALQHAELISVLPSLHPEDPNDDPLPKSRIIEHSALKSLILKCIPFAVVLDSLYLPNLAELTLEHTAQASFGNIIAFIHRSDGCKKLEKLTLSGSLFLKEPEGALTRSMSSSSLPSSIPPSPIAENGPDGSPFAPSSSSNLASSPSVISPPIPDPMSASLHDVLSAASSLTTVILEDWSPVQNPSPYDALFESLSRSGEAGMLKSDVSLPGTPKMSQLGMLGTPIGGMTPGFGMTPGLGFNTDNQFFNSTPHASAIPQHLQRSNSRGKPPLAGLPPHLANNPHIAAASAHLAAAGIHLPPGVLNPQHPHGMFQVDTPTLAQNPGPFSPGFPGSPATAITNFASVLENGGNSSTGSLEGARTHAAVNAALGVLGIVPDVFLPNLKTITISNLSKNTIDLHLLAGMIESRWRGWLQTEQSQSSELTTPSPSASPSTPSSPIRTPTPSIISSLSLYTNLRLIKNKGSVGRIKALQKETEENAREGKGERVKVYVSGKQWGGIGIH